MPKRAVNEPIIEFNPKLPKLSENESKVLKILVQAGKLIAPIYLEQEKETRLGIKDKEIIESSKKNPDILSPYTIVEERDGELIVTPYHIKYAKFLQPIAQKLMEAAKITNNRQFAQALMIQAEALLEGSYDKATATWLKIDPYILDIYIGPVEHFDDQLFFGKATYQSWVGILDSEGTKRLNRYKTIALSVSRKAIKPHQRICNPENIKAKTIDVCLFSGFMAKTKFVGVNLPMNPAIVKKYGSEITIFNQPNDLRMKEQILPSFKILFSKAFKEGFTMEDLRRGDLRYIALHELAHSYLYYTDAPKRLTDYFVCIYELAATVLGLRMSGHLLLEEVITNKQLESMIVTFICRSVYLIKNSQKDKYMINRVLGSAIFINFMLRGGALKKFDGKFAVNFTKVFVALNELSNISERLLSKGRKKDADIFIKEYGVLNKD